MKFVDLFLQLEITDYGILAGGLSLQLFIVQVIFLEKFVLFLDFRLFRGDFNLYFGQPFLTGRDFGFSVYIILLKVLDQSIQLD